MRASPFPRNVRRALDRLLDERDRLEQRAISGMRRPIGDLKTSVRAAIEGASNPASPWSIPAHARVLRWLRELGAQFGVQLSNHAASSAREAAALGAEHSHRALEIVGRRKIDAPEIEIPGNEIDARTDGVGTSTGAEVGQMGVATSYLEATRPSPKSGAVVGIAVAGAMLARAESGAERVIVTEVTAAATTGTLAFEAWLVTRVRGVQRRWDASRDSKTCIRCRELDGRVVPVDESFPGDIPGPPRHARCRCAIWPHLADWSLLDALPAATIGLIENIID